MYSAVVSTPSSKVSTETPSHLVPSFDHLVTQWISVVISSEGSSLNSSHLHLLGSSTSPSTEKSHCSRGVWGVGPAERTGKPSSRYCPGGSAVSWLLRRPLKPLEKNQSSRNRKEQEGVEWRSPNTKRRTRGPQGRRGPPAAARRGGPPLPPRPPG